MGPKKFQRIEDAIWQWKKKLTSTAPILNRPYVALKIVSAMSRCTLQVSYDCKFHIVPKRYCNSVTLFDSSIPHTPSKSIALLVQCIVGQPRLLMARNYSNGNVKTSCMHHPAYSLRCAVSEPGDNRSKMLAYGLLEQWRLHGLARLANLSLKSICGITSAGPRV